MYNDIFFLVNKYYYIFMNDAIACIIYWVIYLILELPIWLKNIFPTDFFIRLDSIQPSDLLFQLPILIAGIVIYFAGWILTFKVSSKRFEKVDL